MTIVYHCDLCQMVYDTEEECLNCEQSHVKAVSIEDQEFYQPDEELEPSGPRQIFVALEDGSRWRYARVEKVRNIHG